MPRISSPRPLDLTKPFVTSSQSYGSQPFDLSQNLVTWYRDVQGDFVPDISGRGNTARCAGSGSHSRVTGSSDIPEFNPLNYPLRSFDLSAAAGSSAVSDEIVTVDSSGGRSSYDDHSFTNGTRDVAFSISFWLKLDSTSSTQYIITKSRGSTTNEWSIVIPLSNTIRIELGSQGSTSPYIYAQLSSAFTSGGWDHFVFTYDGSQSHGGIKVYRNGQLTSTTNNTLGGTYSGMSKINMPLVIGNASLGISDLRGKIYSFAIWKNRSLTLSEISSLYYAYVNGPGGEARSGFISRSPRLMLRELDDLPGSYSTVRRTGDPTRTGALSSNFNDETSIVFSSAGNVVFPTMLPKGSSFASQAVDIIGQESDISASLPIRSFQQPNHLHYSPTESVGPFNENRVMPATAFFLSGTDPDILPGFTSPVRSKIAIEIDITPQSDTMLMRGVGRSASGFIYYNFSRKEWEQIGLIDPANGTNIHYAYETVGSTPTGSYPSQFTLQGGGTATQQYIDNGVDARSAYGYDKIGTPTSALGAPAATKYHATASQTLRMSDHISSPFLVEAFAVEIDEVNVQRLNGYDDDLGFPVSENGSVRDIDNYVFFMYRQIRGSRPRDSASDVSGSNRHLILSSSMTFWNSASIQPSNDLLHAPAFQYEWGLPYNSTPAVGAFTGSIKVEGFPSVCGMQLSNTSVVVQPFVAHAWPGGTSITRDASKGYSGVLYAFDPTSAFAVSPTNWLSSFKDTATSISLTDSHAFRKFGGENVAFSTRTIGGTSITTTGAPQSTISPFILLPTDEIVIGMEAGVPYSYNSDNNGHFTGSFMRIKNKPCRVRLFGSLISDSKESQPSLNQDLSSNSIHEIIGAEAVLDQFQIEPRSSYYGSYLDDIVTGSMAILNPDGITFTIYDQDNSRRVISRTST
jgi:hypothetical protein